MSRQDPAPRTIRGRALACPLCQGTLFHTHDYLLNTRAAAFLNLDWTNRAATVFVCDGCGHILWFAANPESAT